MKFKFMRCNCSDIKRSSEVPYAQLMNILDMRYVSVKSDILAIVDGYEDWDEENEALQKYEQQSLSALLAFRESFSKLEPAKVYRSGQHHTWYLKNLLLIRREFEKKRYANVCYELSKLLYENNDIFLQPRIYYNVLKILDHYLEGED